MAKADRVHSTPPLNTSVPEQLLRQEREREKALRRLSRLRKKASLEIDRLISFLDASDPYAATELEEQVDDGPCDTDELEPDLGSLEPNTKYDFLGRSPWVARSFDQSRFQGEDAEADDSDDEPSLGFLGSIYQDGSITMGMGDDREDEHDGTEPPEDAEPSLGSTNCPHNQSRWADGRQSDLEQDDCDREDDDPAEESEPSGIADHDGLLEQVGYRDGMGDRGMG